MSQEKPKHAERTPNRAKIDDARNAAEKNGSPDPFKPLPSTKFSREQARQRKEEKKEFQKASRKMLMFALMHGAAGGESMKNNRKAAHKAALEKRKLQLGTSTQHGTARQLLQQQHQESTYPVSWRDIVRGAHIM